MTFMISYLPEPHRMLERLRPWQIVVGYASLMPVILLVHLGSAEWRFRRFVKQCIRAAGATIVATERHAVE